jgi:hypothetical protein
MNQEQIHETEQTEQIEQIEMEEILILNGVYEHFKGGLYSVIAVALDSSNKKKVVVYQNLEDGKIWTRDFEEFIGEKDIDGIKIKRFEHIGYEDASLFCED